jgi:hypothetical protein
MKTLVSSTTRSMAAQRQKRESGMFSAKVMDQADYILFVFEA